MVVYDHRAMLLPAILPAPVLVCCVKTHHHIAIVDLCIAVCGSSVWQCVSWGVRVVYRVVYEHGGVHPIRDLDLGRRRMSLALDAWHRQYPLTDSSACRRSVYI